jgi:ADP-ribose pyrophosphatase YjhB (NUDIX family)
MLVKVFGKIWKRMPGRARRWLIRRAEATFTISVAGIVTDDAGEVLLLEHVLRPGPGWGLPGGFINANEQPDEGLRREIREETGLELSNIELVRVRTLDRHVEIVFTARGIGEARVNSSEITALGWFAVDEMPGEMALDQQFIIKNALRTETRV